MNTNEGKEMLVWFSVKYKECASDNIVRNNHMNDLTSEERISQEKIDKTVDSFVSRIKEIQEIPLVTAIDFLNFLKEQAKEEDRNRESDAVLVDFINYIARKNWIDYALYTIDLQDK